MSAEHVSQSSPIVIGFGSIPGGTGCTMLATHFAVFSARLGLRTLAMSVDRNADMQRRLGGESLCIDGSARSKYKRLKLAYCPPDLFREVGVENVVDYLPNLGFSEIPNPQIVIVDLGPAEASRLAISADHWVVPVMDSRSIRSLMERNYPRGKVLTILLRTFCDDGALTREEVSRVLKEHPPHGAFQFMSAEIPQSGLLMRSCNEYKTIWELGTPLSLSRRRIDAFCSELLGLVAPSLVSGLFPQREDAPPKPAARLDRDEEEDEEFDDADATVSPLGRPASEQIPYANLADQIAKSVASTTSPRRKRRF